MRIQFTYEIADLKEMLTPPMNAARRAARRRLLIVNVFVWIFAGVSLGLLFRLRSLRPQPLWKLDGTPIDFISDVLPALLCAGNIYLLFGLVLWKSLRGGLNAPPSSVPGERTMSARFIGIAFVLLAGGLFLVFLHQEFVLPISPTRTQRILLSGGPWALAMALLFASGTVQRRRAAAIQRKGDPSWNRQKTVEIDISGYGVADEVEQHHYAWCHFIRARETEHLFVLHAEDSRQHLIPKRAFANPTDLQACRSLFQSMIGRVDFLVAPTGFQVIAQSVLP